MSMMTVSVNWNVKPKKRVDLIEASWGSLSVPEAPLYLGFAGSYGSDGGLDYLVAQGPDVMEVKRITEEVFERPDTRWAYVAAVKDNVTIIARRDGWDIDKDTIGYGWLPGGYDE